VDTTVRTNFVAVPANRPRSPSSVSGPVRQPSSGVTFVPYEDGPLGTFDSIGYLERMLADSSSGMDLPAAVIVEPLQMEGGVYPASREWLRALRELTARHGSCSSATSSSPAAAVPARSSASSTPRSSRTSSRCPSRSAATACHWR
jgi:hypothetical protein